MYICSIGNVNTKETEMSLPSLPAQYKVHEGTADPVYEEIGPPQPVVEGGENQYSFVMGPCTAYKLISLKNTHLK